MIVLVAPAPPITVTLPSGRKVAYIVVNGRKVITSVDGRTTTHRAK